MERYASLVLRIGLAFVFFWFGFSQVLHPNSWIALIPDFMTSTSGLSARSFVLLNGYVEIAGAAFLILGFWTRIVSLLLFLHLISIIFDLGLTLIGVRDVGLAAATLALALSGPGTFSVDQKSKQRITQKYV